VRSPLRALLNRTPVPYVSGRNLSFPWRHLTGAEAQMRAMGTVGTLFSIVNRTSNATAQVNWRLYRKAASGLKEDRVEVTRHAALDVWNNPNPFMTRQELVEVGQQHIDLTGEGWLTVAYNPRSPMPLELWPVRPDRMAPVPHPTDFINRYEYTGPSGEKIPLKLNEVIFMRTPNPLDPYRGMGAVQTILVSLDSAQAAEEWNRNFFRNSAEPGGIIEVPNELQDNEFNEMTARWQEQHQGVSNAHRIAVLEHGAKWVERKYTMRDMQFVELSKASDDKIMKAFGVPAFVLGEVGDVNRATAEASKVLFAELLTVPRLERWKQALNHDLLPLYGPATAGSLEFDYDDPVPPDAAARNAELAAKTTAYKTLIDAGAEPRLAVEYLGLPDLGYRPPAPAAPGSAVAARAAASRLDIHHHAPQVTARTATRRPLALPAAPAVAASGDEEADAEEVREPLEDALDMLLERWEDIADAQYEELAAQIEKAVDKKDSAALAELTVSTDDAADVLRAALAQMAEVGAKQVVAEAAEQGVKVRKPQLSKRLRNAFGSELVEIAQATATLLGSDAAGSAGREALRLMVPGADGEGVAGQVVGFLKGLKNWFRRDQLGGALHRAQNAGRVATLEAAPKAAYFSDERRDRNTCSPCREIDGTEFEDLAAANAAYATGGYQLCEGGVRCRGTVVARWD
jgi:HK97 family phage portal protein